jgi:hypothetical protein
VTLGIVASVVGVAAAIYYFGPKATVIMVKIYEDCKIAYYAVLASRPLSVLDRMILHYPNSPPPRATVGEIIYRGTPYIEQFASGLSPSPPGPFRDMRELGAYGLGVGTARAYERVTNE